MQAPTSPSRPPRRQLCLDPNPTSILKAGSAATYDPSDAFKLTWFGQLVEGTDGDTCPQDLPKSPGALTAWLREAIRGQLVGGRWVDDFPEYVWLRLDDGRTFECRMYQDMTGSYYGYPVRPVDLPRGV